MSTKKNNICANDRCKTVRKSGADNRNFHDYVGKMLGELIVLEELPPHITPNGSKQRIVRCRCSCGVETTMRLEKSRYNWQTFWQVGSYIYG